MNSIGSLSFITDNSPAWITRLDDLTGQIASRQAELAELANRPLKQRQGSTESLRPQANLEDVEARLEQYNPILAANAANAARQYKAQQLRRKRKTASLASNGSGTSTYRTRSMIIVYYDSAVQEAFEMIVRNIGTARNNIRKGKMASAMKKMTAAVDDMDSDPDAVDTLRTKLGTYTKTTKVKAGEEKTVYDHIDTGLDFSQAQCERAAHQFLRDGDCAEEILSIRNKMQELNELASGELQRIRLEEERAEQVKARKLLDPTRTTEQTVVAEPKPKPKDNDKIQVQVQAPTRHDTRGAMAARIAAMNAEFDDSD